MRNGSGALSAPRLVTRSKAFAAFTALPLASGGSIRDRRRSRPCCSDQYCDGSCEMPSISRACAGVATSRFISFAIRAILATASALLVSFLPRA